MGLRFNLQVVISLCHMVESLQPISFPDDLSAGGRVFSDTPPRIKSILDKIDKRWLIDHCVVIVLSMSYTSD